MTEGHRRRVRGTMSRTTGKMRVAMIGTGDITALQHPAYADCADAELVAICDTNPELLAERQSDLMMNIFSECHCAGHQLWHLHDASHPLHDAELVTELGGDPLKEIYQALDSALARILDAVDHSMRVLLYCIHGLGPAFSSTHILSEDLMCE